MKSIVKLPLLLLYLLSTVTNYGNVQIKKNKAQKEYLNNLHIIQDCMYKDKKVSGEVFDGASIATAATFSAPAIEIESLEYFGRKAIYEIYTE